MDIQKRIKDQLDDFQSIRRDLSNWEKDMKLREKKLKTDFHNESNEELPPVRTKLGNNNKTEKLVHSNHLQEKQSSENHELATIERDLGHNLAESQHWTEAVNHYTKAIDHFNKDPSFYCDRAYCYLQVEKWKEAVDDCNVALQMDPKYIKAYHRRALALRKQNFIKESDQDLQEAFKLGRKDKQILQDLTATDKILLNQTDEQIKNRLNRGESLFFKELGNKAVWQRNWTEAISHYSQAIEIFSQDATFYCNRALCYLQTKQFKLAETDCTIALQIDDQYSKAYYRRALALKELKQLKESREDFVKAHEIDPTVQVKNDLLKLDKLLADAGMLPHTNADMKNETTKETNRNLAFTRKEKGNLYVKKKEWSSAIECYTEACNLHPEESSFYLNRALCFLKTNQPKKTILDCIRVIEMDPINVKAYYRRALAYKILGNFSKAHDDLLVAFRLDQSNKTIEEELAKLEKSMGILPQENIEEKVNKIRPDSYNSLSHSKTLRARLTGERFTKMGAYFVQPAKKPSSKSSSLFLKDIKIADKSENSLQKALAELSKVPAEPKKQKKVPKKIVEPVPTSAADVHETSQAFEEVDVESLPSPRTSVQFVSSWNKLTSPELQYQFLKKIDGKHLPSIFEDSFETYLFSDILEILATKFVENNDKVYSYVFGLGKVKRISALLLFATDEDNANISSLFNHIEKTKEVSQDELVSLKSQYYY